MAPARTLSLEAPMLTITAVHDAKRVTRIPPQTSNSVLNSLVNLVNSAS